MASLRAVTRALAWPMAVLAPPALVASETVKARAAIASRSGTTVEGAGDTVVLAVAERVTNPLAAVVGVMVSES